jgi:hypothetical protein
MNDQAKLLHYKAVEIRLNQLGVEQMEIVSLLCAKFKMPVDLADAIACEHRFGGAILQAVRNA